MILTKKEILSLISSNELKIEPFDEEMLGNDSIDLRLGSEILVARDVNRIIDSKAPINYWEKIETEGFILKPGKFILASTLERVSLPEDIMAFIEGRSSIGRLGIMVHVTAGIIHAGFGKKEPSSITLEIYSVNPNPVKLHAGMRVAQLVFMKLTEKTEAYDFLKRSKYTSQKGPLPPKPDF